MDFPISAIKPAFPSPLPLDQIADKFRELIGLDEIPGDVDFTVRSTVMEDGLELILLSYFNCVGEPIHAIAILPA